MAAGLGSDPTTVRAAVLDCRPWTVATSGTGPDGDTPIRSQGNDAVTWTKESNTPLVT
jgi:hypothetical protein